MTCENSAKIHAYADGELDAGGHAAVEAHLRDCADCATLLADLRGLSSMIAAAPLPLMPERAVSRFQGGWHAARDRGLVRVASWLTGVAAAVLIGAILTGPVTSGGQAVRSTAWEVRAVTPPAADMTAEGGGADLVSVAQWMAEDLSVGGGR